MPPSPPPTRSRSAGGRCAAVPVALWAEDLETVTLPFLRYQPGSIPGITALAAAVEQPVGDQGGALRYLGVYPPDPGLGLFSGHFDGNAEQIERIALEDGTLRLNHSPAETIDGLAFLDLDFPAA